MFGFVLGVLMPIFSLTLPFLGSLNQPQILATRAYSLEDRYPEKGVNLVFKENILLALQYMENPSIDASHIKFTDIEKPAVYTFTLQPGDTFAFHDDVLPEYKGKVFKTMNSHFNSSEGFVSDGYLVGDGVCHLASLLYWAAQDAKLNAYAPTRHDFAPVPDVPAEYGTSIYSGASGSNSSSELQNLYITNNKDMPVTFEFDNTGTSLTIKVIEESSLLQTL